MKDMGEVITAVVTPFNEDYSINMDAYHKLLEHLVNNGSDGLLISGTTGESPTLCDNEKIELFKCAKENFGRQAKILAGTGSNDTSHTIELSKEAENIGVDALLLVTPYYNKPSQWGLFKHFEEIASKIKIPIIIYNVPSRTSCNIESKTCVELSKIDNIIGIKEASCNFRQISEIIRDTGKEFLVYSGNDGDTLPILSLGGYGVISVASHIIGKEIKKMLKIFKGGKVVESAAMHSSLLDIFYGIFIETSPIPIKEALNLIGINVGKCRPPLYGMDKEKLESLKNILKNHNLI